MALDYRAALERLVATPSGFEWVPQVWHVIYEEGIRGNHILFDDDEIAEINRLLRTQAADRFFPDVEGHAVALLRLNSVPAIRSRLATMDLEQKVSLFLVYQCGLQLWGSALRRLLN